MVNMNVDLPMRNKHGVVNVGCEIGEVVWCGDGCGGGGGGGQKMRLILRIAIAGGSNVVPISRLVAVFYPHFMTRSAGDVMASSELFVLNVAACGNHDQF